MGNAKLVEPEFDLVKDIEVVRPDNTRFPTGQYMALTPRLGIWWPPVPYGPKGVEMGAALDSILKLVRDTQEIPQEIASFQNRLSEAKAAQLAGGKGFDKEGNAEAILELTQKIEEKMPTVTKIYERASGPAMELYRAGLKFNYKPETIDWIEENAPVSPAILHKLISGAQGDVVDEGMFSDKP